MSEHSQTSRLPPSAEQVPVHAQRFDYERYRHHLDRLDLPEAAKRQLGEALHTLLRNQVDRAWGDDPVQRARAVGDHFRTAAEGGGAPVLGSDDQ